MSPLVEALHNFPMTIETTGRPDVSVAGRGLISNMLKTAAGTLRGRGGYLTFATLGTEAVDGIFESATFQTLFSVFNGGLSVIADDGTTTTLSGAVMVTGTVARFDEDSQHIYSVNGAQINYANTTTAAVITALNSPQRATHIACYAGFLIANDISTTESSNKLFYRFGQDNLAAWNSFDFFATGRRTDPILGHYINNRLGWIYIYGSNTIEVWAADGSSFAPVENGSLPDGALSVDTIQRLEGQGGDFIFLNDKRDICILEGLSSKAISDPVAQVLERYRNLNTARSYLTKEGGDVHYHLQIGAESADDGSLLPALTLVYSLKSQTFSVQYTTTATTAAHAAMPITCVVTVPRLGKQLACCNTNGLILDYGAEHATDNGEAIEQGVRFDLQKHNTNAIKFCSALYIHAKMGQGRTYPAVGGPQMRLRWRDNGRIWSNWRYISLGSSGDWEFIRSEWLLGSYRARQWEILCNEKFLFELVDVREIFDLGTLL